MPDRLSKAITISRGLGRRMVMRPLEALLICRLAFWVGVISIAARYLTLPRALEIISPSRSENSSHADLIAHETLVRNLDLILSADFFLFRPVCWKRAAVLHRFLLLNGINTKIRFGIRPGVDGKIDGHAWLESNGQAIFESSPPDYVITYTFPSAEPFIRSVVFSTH